MKRTLAKKPALIDLGSARAHTRGPAGAPIDEVQGFLPTGLAND
jgi:hypothetical protein